MSLSTGPSEPSRVPEMLAMENGCASVGRVLTDGKSTYFQKLSVIASLEKKMGSPHADPLSRKTSD